MIANRKGRATGVHLCINSQRLSADIIPPQINSNLKFKFCGFADDILSRIILENTDAHDLLKDEIAGIFVDGNHNVVQVFNIDSEIEPVILKPFEIIRNTMSDFYRKYDIGKEEFSSMSVAWNLATPFANAFLSSGVCGKLTKTFKQTPP